MNKAPNSKLKEARLRRNWSQEKISHLLGIDRKTYTYGFIMQFATQDHLRVYAEHPVHQAAGRGLVEISESIIDYDLQS